jgi:predicted nucleic acid-binding protein
MLLADTTAWLWSRQAPLSARNIFDSTLAAGQLATCDIVKLELLAAVHDPAEHRRRRHELDALHFCPIGPGEWARAFEVQNLLAGLQPEEPVVVRPSTLLVAAAAESAGLQLLHYDREFGLIQKVTGQPMAQLAETVAA